MSEVMSQRSVEETPFISGPPQAGDDLVSFREPGIRGVGVKEAAEALKSGFGENWQDDDLTDDDKRRWQLGELVTRDAVAPKDELLKIIKLAAEIEKPEIHGVAEMTQGFVPELRKMLGATGLGASIDQPFDSQLMRLIQIRIPETSMYDIFPMAHGPLIATPKAHSLVAASEERGHEPGIIGKIIEEPVILIRSLRSGHPGEVLSYDV